MAISTKPKNQLTTVDRIAKTLIHNIVANCVHQLPDAQYALSIIKEIQTELQVELSPQSSEEKPVVKQDEGCKSHQKSDNNLIYEI